MNNKKIYSPKTGLGNQHANKKNYLSSLGLAKTPEKIISKENALIDNEQSSEINKYGLSMATSLAPKPIKLPGRKGFRFTADVASRLEHFCFNNRFSEIRLVEALLCRFLKNSGFPPGSTGYNDFNEEKNEIIIDYLDKFFNNKN